MERIFDEQVNKFVRSAYRAGVSNPSREVFESLVQIGFVVKGNYHGIDEIRVDAGENGFQPVKVQTVVLGGGKTTVFVPNEGGVNNG